LPPPAQDGLVVAGLHRARLCLRLDHSQPRVGAADGPGQHGPLDLRDAPGDAPRLRRRAGRAAHCTSKRFATGWRRYPDWLDRLHPDAWAHEHNPLHHYHTGQQQDPDLVERNAAVIRHRGVPRLVKGALVVLLMMTWKLTYYAPNTFFALKQHRAIRAVRRAGEGQPAADEGRSGLLDHPRRARDAAGDGPGRRVLAALRAALRGGEARTGSDQLIREWFRPERAVVSG